MKTFSLFLFLILSGYSIARSQSVNPFWINYTNGNCVTDVAVKGDSLWVATTGGITLLDTVNGTANFFNGCNSGLRSNQVSHIRVDQNNNKWVATSNGLDEFSASGWTHHYPVGLSESIYSIEVDRFNNVWFIGLDTATSAKCLMRIQNGVISRFDSLNSGLPSSIVSAITVDRMKNLYVVAGDCIVKYDGANWSVIDSSYTGLRNLYIYTFVVDVNQNFWLGTYFTVEHFDGLSWNSFSSSNSPITNVGLSGMTADDSGNVFICNRNQLLKTNGTNWTVFDTSNCPAAQYRFVSCVVDAQNNLLTGTEVNGLYTLRNGIWNRYNTTGSGIAENFTDQIILCGRNKAIIQMNSSYSMKDNAVWTSYYAEPQGQLVEPGRMAKDTSSSIVCGLKYNSSVNPGPIAAVLNDTSWSYSSFINNSCYDVTIDHNNITWFGTTDGLVKFDGTTWTTYTPANSPLADIFVMRVFADRNDNIWVNTPYGALQKFDGVNWQTINISGFPGLPMQDIVEDYAGNIWMSAGWLGTGVTTKIGRYTGTSWVMLNNTPGDIATGLAIDNDNNLWAIFLGIGIGKYNGSTWTVYTPANSGLPDAFVHDIQIDEYNNVWIATSNSGLVLFNETGITFDIPAQRRVPVSGTCYLDADSNGVKAVSEPYLNAQKIFELPDSIISSTNSHGFYSMYLLPGNYNIAPLPLNDWRISSDSLMYHVAVDTGLAVNGLDFGLTAPAFHNYSMDVNYAPVRCGFTVPYWIHYTNNGSVRDSGFVRLVMDTAADFVNASPSPDIINGNVYEWHFSNMTPFQDNFIYFNLGIPLSPVDSLHHVVTLTYYDQVTPVQAVITSFDDEIICAADPNDKLVFPAGIGAFHDTYFRDTLMYTIRFQNVGNDTAFFIKVVDTLDAALDVSTFDFISSSEVVAVSGRGRVLVFDIPSCAIPPASLNEPASHGFLQFKIAPEVTVPMNTQVRNFADIYFNFNSCIRTNEVFNTLVDSLNIGITTEEMSSEKMKVSPNPASEYTEIIYPNLNRIEFNVDLYSLTGVKLASSTDNTGNFRYRFDANLTAGAYFLIISNSEKRYFAKIIISSAGN